MIKVLKIIINLGLIWFAFIYLSYGWIEIDWHGQTSIESLFFITIKLIITLVTILLTLVVTALLWNKDILERRAYLI